MTADETGLRAKYEAADQAHVFAFWDELDAGARKHLLAQLDDVDLPLVEELAGLLARPTEVAADVRFEPPDVFPLDRDADQALLARAAVESGREELAAGRVAHLLVAGGQGSRLGFDGPKGMFPVGPVSGRSLFELFARKLLAARERYGAAPLWYVMTSGSNDAATRAFFDQHGHFGLDPARVRFFRQALLPALDGEGRIVLAAKDTLFLAPNGHGGVLSALAASGGLAHAREHGVERFSYFQVDNPLANPADPLFIGLHHLAHAQMSTKVVDKRGPDEKVGVLGMTDGRLGCIEYSNLPAELRNATNGEGGLLFRAGNIAAHVLDRAFVEHLTQGGLKLPWHLARKQLACIDEHGAPTQREGVKFETFVFDALQFTASSVVLEVERSEEFSPVKNALGQDSPDTARAAQCARFASWVRAAGLVLPPEDESGLHAVEIDPLIAENEAEFVARGPCAPRVMGNAGHLYT